jgi:hypothetical protein
MSALIIVAQQSRNCVHIATDALSYTTDQIPSSFGNKSLVVPQWPGVITCVGSGGALHLLAPAVASNFSDIDDLIERGNDVLPAYVEQWRSEMLSRNVNPSTTEMVIAGLSASGPKVRSFRTGEDIPPSTTREEAEASPYWADGAGQLVELPDYITTPVAPPEMARAARWEGFDPDASPEMVRWSMLKHLTMQRHMPTPDGLGGIGGFGQMVSVYADHIEQYILCRWPQDKLGGAPIHGGPIDWDQWHRDNPKPGSAIVSRLKRDMADRKARKHLRMVD